MTPTPRLKIPVEINTHILALSTVPTLCWNTYRSLIVVSRDMQAVAYHVYLPHLPIMLHTRKHVDSFRMLLESNPNVVGPRIRTLWTISGIKAEAEFALGRIILQKCTQITHLACNISLLKSLVCESTTFSHHNLKHLTIIEPIIPWDYLLSSPAGRQLFNQLTHLRTNGGTNLILPSSDFSFSSLTHLSFSCHQLSFGQPPFGQLSSGSRSTSPFDPIRFPVLQQIAPSLPYMNCRTSNPAALGAKGREIDARISVIACPKKWKEADVWKKAIKGENDLWVSARAGKYLQRSRAFTQESPRWDDYGFDSDYEMGGESGL